MQPGSRIFGIMTDVATGNSSENSLLVSVSHSGTCTYNVDSDGLRQRPRRGSGDLCRRQHATTLCMESEEQIGFHHRYSRAGFGMAP